MLAAVILIALGSLLALLASGRDERADPAATGNRMNAGEANGRDSFHRHLAGD